MEIEKLWSNQGRQLPGGELVILKIDVILLFTITFVIHWIFAEYYSTYFTLITSVHKIPELFDLFYYSTLTWGKRGAERSGTARGHVTELALEPAWSPLGGPPACPWTGLLQHRRQGPVRLAWPALSTGEQLVNVQMPEASDPRITTEHDF